MTRQEILNLINEAIEAESGLTEDVSISDNPDMDSLSILSIFLKFKENGINCQITDFIKCQSIADIIDLVVDNV